ncbi:unnamed protein product [Adineta ricciae]|uniref:Peptidase C14 caspase domain-containing protein n=1 Tax=Adineta ricciae TaxID=249248 RepID=A0A814FWY4_ADIRI|nr:unnamed protein product [Adineta ricciae]CAF0988361.1 unnamed protein product [Adineta ricciae]
MTYKQALSIGINDYSPSYLRLRPCLNDATDMHHALQSIGFHTQCERDPDLKSMKAVTQRFVRSIRPGSVVLFYFSGHGVQSDGNNYLIPKDAVGICAENIRSTAIDAQKLINEMHGRRPRLIICVLDCCRTDPPTEPLDARSRYKAALAGTRGGFAPMQAPPSTIVVYACAADDTASPRSRNGRNSLYTYHLLRYLRTPNTDIETVLRYVAAAVQKDSENKQIPFRYSSCNEMIYLVTKQGVNPKMISHPMHRKPHAPYLDASQYRHRRAMSLYHAQPPMNHYQYPLNGYFGAPVYPQFHGRYNASPMPRAPSRYDSPYAHDLRYY